jgi:hypothetical protein
MSRPTALDTPKRIAEYLQFNEEDDFKGIPTSGPSWIIDMRDVRGYKQVMSRLPPKIRGQPVAEQIHFGKCVMRLLSVLAIPGKYGSILQETNAVIADTERLIPCNFGTNPTALSDADVAVLLAERGMTVAVAADTWQFCINYVKAQIQKPDSFIHQQTMVQIFESATSANVAPPPRLHSLESDQFPRSVPSKHRKLKVAAKTGPTRR